jgi:hypothetical protein
MKIVPAQHLGGLLNFSEIALTDICHRQFKQIQVGPVPSSLICKSKRGYSAAIISLCHAKLVIFQPRTAGSQLSEGVNIHNVDTAM